MSHNSNRYNCFLRNAVVNAVVFVALYYGLFELNLVISLVQIAFQYVQDFIDVVYAEPVEYKELCEESSAFCSYFGVVVFLQQEAGGVRDRGGQEVWRPQQAADHGLLPQTLQQQYKNRLRPLLEQLYGGDQLAQHLREYGDVVGLGELFHELALEDLQQERPDESLERLLDLGFEQLNRFQQLEQL